MAETRGVFTLDRLRTRVKKGTWVTPDQVFFAGSSLGPSPNTAYTCGGGGSSIVDKTTLSDGTTTRIPGANLTIARSYPGSVGSMNHGYVNGGWAPAISTLERITYSSDTTAAVPGANGVVNRYAVKAAGNTTDGYWGGGSVPGVSSIIDRLSYASETYSRSPATLLSQAKYHLSAAGTSDAGFFMGGSPDGSSVFTAVDKLTYAVGTAFRLPSANLPSSNAGWAAAGVASPRSVSSGGVYYAGGRTGGGVQISSVSKMTYSAETTSLLPTALSSIRYIFDGTNSSSHGYFTGGFNGTNNASTIDKWDFSNDTTTNLPSSGNLTVRGDGGVSGHTSFSAKEAEKPEFRDELQESNLKGEVQGPNAGYITMGASNISTINRTDYTTDATFLIPATLTAARAYGSAIGSKTNIYFSTGTSSTVTDRLTYATETSVRVPGANTINQHYDGACAENAQKTFGYLLMGQNPPSSNVEKLQYSTETYANVPSAALNSRRHLNGSSGANNSGYAYAGYTGSGGVSEIQKTDFTTDTSQVLTTKLGNSGWGSCATGNSTDGYTSSVSGNTNVYRLNYATETSSTFSQLPAARSSGGGAGNQFNGYLSGGAPDPALKSNVDKMNYATGTTVRLPSTAFLTFAQYGCTANTGFYKNSAYQQQQPTPTLSTSDIPSSPNTAYWAGGIGPSLKVDKLEYSTDIMARVPGADLSGQHYQMGSTGNTTTGYFAGGVNPGHLSLVDKLTYSTDTTSPAPTIPEPNFNSSGVASPAAGYFSGGQPSPTAKNTTFKISFSDDSSVAVPGATMPTGVFYTAATGNSTHGYFGGGRNPGLTPINITTLQKLTYSSETFADVPSGALSAARYGHTASGNSEAGYFTAGYSIGWFPSNGFVTVVDKISYSTDTRSISPGVGVEPRGFRAGTGSSSAGYAAGGNTTGPDTTQTEKLTFTTETSTILPGAFLSEPVWANAAVSARANSVSATSNIV